MARNPCCRRNPHQADVVDLRTRSIHRLNHQCCVALTKKVWSLAVFFAWIKYKCQHT